MELIEVLTLFTEISILIALFFGVKQLKLTTNAVEENGSDINYRIQSTNHSLNEVIKVGCDLADAAENMGSMQVQVAQPRAADPKQILFETIQGLILSKLHPEEYGSEKSSEWQVQESDPQTDESEYIESET